MYKYMYNTVLRSTEERERTVDDKGEVPVAEGGLRDGHAALVEGIVQPLVGLRPLPGGHVQDPLHRVLWSGADQVPVDHPLAVAQPVPGPHHAGTVAGQHCPGAHGVGEVLGLHHPPLLPVVAALAPSCSDQQVDGWTNEKHIETEIHS